MTRQPRVSSRSLLSGARLGLATLVALLGACGPGQTPEEPSEVADIAAKVAQAAAAVTGQDAPLANAYEKGHYVGFDTHTYPGTAVMRACCLLYTSDAADERSSVDLGGRRIIKKK